MLRRLAPAGLRARLLLLVLVAVAPALVALAYNVNVGRRLALEAASAEALQIVGLVAETEAQYVEQGRQILVRLSQLPSIRRGIAGGCREAFNDLQTQYLQQFPRYANLGTVDPSGEIYCSVLPVSGGTNIGDRHYFQSALRSLALTVGEYAIDPDIEKSTLSLFYPVVDFGGGQAELVVFATLDLNGLSELVRQSGLPEGATFSVVDSGGRILVGYAEAQPAVGQSLPEAEVLTAMRQSRGPGTVTAEDATGVQRLFAYAPLGNDDLAGGAYAIVGVPADVILAQANQERNNNLLALGLALGLALAGAWFGGDLFVLRQVQALVRATQRLSAGDLTARTGLPAGRAELNQLGTAFDQMAASLEERERDRERIEADVREREAQYRAIFESSSDGLIVSDHDTGATVQANPAACAMHGYPPEVFVKLPPTALVHPDYHPSIREYQRTLRAGGRFEAQVVHVRQDGTPFHVSVHGTGVYYGGRLHFLAVLRDITEQVQSQQLLERRVRERTRELSALLRFQRNVAATLDLERLLGLVLEQVQGAVECTGISVMTLENDRATIQAYRGPAAQADVVGYQFPVKGTYAEFVVARQAPYLVADLRADSDETLTIDDTARERRDRVYGYVRSWMGVPLIANDECIGLLVLHHMEPDYFDTRHAELTLAFASQAAVAIQNAQLYQQATQLAALQERQKLARELHDSVSQALFSIALGARTARTQLDRDPVKAVEPLDYVLSLAQAALAEMRALIFELRPESLEQNGLVVVLNRQAESLRVRHRLEVTTQLGEEPAGSLEVKQAVYRIAQEALHNIVKHARAARVEVTLDCLDGVLRLEVRDDGAGFDLGGEFPGHLGLRSMRERAQQLGGTLTVESAVGQGTRVVAEVPVKRGG